MHRPPRDPKSPLFDARMLMGSVALGLAVLAGVLAVYAWAVHAGRSDGEARAIGFAAIVFGNIALILDYRAGERFIFQWITARNPALWWIVALALAALLASIYLAPVAETFRFAALGAVDLAAAAVAGVAGVAIHQLAKLAAVDRRQ